MATKLNKHAEVLTKEEEEQLWSTGTMGPDTPTALQNAAFFVVSKCSACGVELSTGH